MSQLITTLFGKETCCSSTDDDNKSSESLRSLNKRKAQKQQDQDH